LHQNLAHDGRGSSGRGRGSSGRGCRCSRSLRGGSWSRGSGCRWCRGRSRAGGDWSGRWCRRRCRVFRGDGRLSGCRCRIASGAASGGRSGRRRGRRRGWCRARSRISRGDGRLGGCGCRIASGIACRIACGRRRGGRNRGGRRRGGRRRGRWCGCMRGRRCRCRRRGARSRTHVGLRALPATRAVIPGGQSVGDGRRGDELDAVHTSCQSASIQGTSVRICIPIQNRTSGAACIVIFSPCVAPSRLGDEIPSVVARWV